jgi:lipopolysaccharide/colanic/teichoic acid biosynthesis glycosyltransferase
MAARCDQSLHRASAADWFQGRDHEGRFKTLDDPRITPVGRWLRRTNLDELPQLVNVVRGEMSLVGPRPLPMRDFNRLEEWHKKRYLVLPGITGLWQISGRSELDFDDLVRLDFLYLERWSIMLDLSILLKTIPAVLSRRGAF